MLAPLPAGLLRVLTVIALAAATLGLPGGVLARSIGDNPQYSGAVTITADRATALLAIDDLVFTVTREVATNAPLEVPVEMSRGIVAPDLVSHTVTIAANRTSAKLTVSTSRRALGATTGDVTATVGDGEHHHVGDPSSASVRVYIGSGLVTLRFNASSLPVGESVGWSRDEVQVMARTSPGVPPPFKNLSFSVITEEGSAKREVDYRGFSRTILVLGESRVRWRADGDSYVSSVQVPIWPIRDDLDEEDETLRLVLQRTPQLPWTVSLIPADSGANPCSYSQCRSEVVLVDDDTRGVTVQPNGTLQVDEGGTATYTVVLDSEPTDDVTVTPRVEEATEADISVSDSLTFTAGNWDSPQRVTVMAGSDQNDVNGSATITHTVEGGDYGSGNVKADPVPVAENDTELLSVPHSGAVTITADRPTALQGIDDLVFTVTREVATTADLEVPVEISAGILPSTRLGHTVTIPADQTSATLTVSTSNRDPDATTGQVTATVGDGGYHGVGDPPSASVQVYVGSGLVTVRLNASSYTVAEGAGQLEGVNLIARTKADVPPPVDGFSVSVVAAEGTAGSPEDYPAISRVVRIEASPTADWVADGDSHTLSVPVPVQIVDDDLDEEDESFDLRLQPLPAQPDSVSLVPADSEARPCGTDGQLGCPSTVTITDDDTRGVTVNQAGPLRIEEGGTAAYTVVLDSQPTEDVIVTPLVEDAVNADISVSEALIFSRETWDVPREVTVTAGPDDNGENGSATITHTVDGGDYGDAGVTADPVPVTESDSGQGVVVTLVRVPDGTVIPDNSTVSVGGTVHDGSTFEEGDWVWFRILLSAADGGPAPGGADVELSLQWRHHSPLVPTSGEISKVVYSLPRADVWDTKVRVLDNDVANPDSEVTIRITGCERNGCVIGDSSQITLTIADDDGGPAAAPPGRPARPRARCLAEGDGYSGTAMTVLWEAPGYVGGAPIDRYEVQYRPLAGEWQVHQHRSAATSTAITGLVPNTTYEVRVRAVNANGPGPWSPMALFPTGLPDQYCDSLHESSARGTSHFRGSVLPGLPGSLRTFGGNTGNHD